MDDNSVLVANPSIVLREEFDDFAVLFDPESGEGYGLNEVGVLVWKLLDGKRTVEQISEQVRDSFAEVDDDVVDQTEQFISELIEKGLAGREV